MSRLSCQDYFVLAKEKKPEGFCALVYSLGTGILLEPRGSVEKHMPSSEQVLSGCQGNVERKIKCFCVVFTQGNKCNNHKTTQLFQL